MSWNNSAYTTLGTAMLAEAMSGKSMDFTRAVSGAGTVAASKLSEATAVIDQRQTLAIADIKKTGEGDDAARKLRIQITNAGLAQSYVMHQIGIYGSLKGEETDALIAIFQDERGFEIPSATENPDFIMEFSAVIAISSTANIDLKCDLSAIATEKWVKELLAEHDIDPDAHKALFDAITAENISFDGAAAGLEADNIQSAISETLGKLDEVKSNLSAEDIAFTDTLGTGITNLQSALDNVLSTTLPKLTVTTVAGSALTLTDGQSTITGTADGSGSYTVALPRMGLWTVTAKLAGLTTDDTIDVETVGGKYTLTLPYFAATLAVTAAPGATVTAALPTGKAYTATADDTGTVQVKLKRSGTYTVSASKGDAKSDTATVDVTESGSTYTATVHFCRLVLTAPVGSAITAACGDVTLTASITGSDETGTVTLYPTTLGTWKVTAVKGEDDTAETIAATEYKDYTLMLDYVKPVLDKNDWKTIRKVSDADKGANYWAVGDIKSITLNGKVGGYTFSNYKVDVFILGFNHNSGKEGAHRIHFQIGKVSGKAVALCDSQYNNSGSSVAFRMNISDTNSGGWNNSYMRETILGNSDTPESPLANSLMAALPDDLRMVLKSVTKYTDNTGGGSNSSGNVTSTTDYLFLLAEFEVFGTRYYANQYEQNSQKQYEYYKAGNSRVAYNHSAVSTAVWWWLRSAYYGSSGYVCDVTTGGSYGSNYATYSAGLRPGFAV